MATPVTTLDAFARILADGGFSTWNALKASLAQQAGTVGLMRRDGKPQDDEETSDQDPADEQLDLFRAASRREFAAGTITPRPPPQPPGTPGPAPPVRRREMTQSIESDARAVIAGLCEEVISAEASCFAGWCQIMDGARRPAPAAVMASQQALHRAVEDLRRRSPAR
jgi:hypothetical protein